MANGSSDNQQQQPLTGDQTVALLRYMNPNISQSVLDQAQKDPTGFGTRLLGGASYGGYGPMGGYGAAGHGQAVLGGVVGAQPVAPLVGLLQAFQPQQQPQQQQPTQSLSATIPQAQTQAYTPPTNPLTATQPANASTTAAAATPYATAAIPTAVQVTPTNPTGSMYNLGQSFTPEQQQWQGYQGGGQVTAQNQPPQYGQYFTSTDYWNPAFQTSELGAAALSGGAGIMPTVINPMPNQGQMGQGSLVSSGVYSGPQQAMVLGPAQGPATGTQAPTPQGPWSYQPGVLSGPAGSNTIGMTLPGNAGSLTPAQSQQISGLYNKALAGDTGAQQAMQTWQQGMGMTNDQVNSMMQGYNQALKGVYTQAYPQGAQAYPTGAPPGSNLTATPWATGVQPTATGAQPAAARPWATAPMPGGQALPAPAIGMPGIANFGGAQPPPAPTGPGMMAQGPPGVARPMAFGGAYQGYTAGVPGIQGGQPAPYTGTVHNDPFMSHAVSTLLGLPSNPWHAPDGSPRGGGMAMPQGAAPAASDTAQAASMALATAPKAPVKMQAGGYVRGYQQGGTATNQDPEVPKTTLSVPQPAGSQASQPQGQSTQSAQSAQATVNNVGNSMASFYGGQPPGAGASVAPAAPGIGTLAGEQAYVTGEPVSGIPGGGGLSQQQGNALAGGIGAIGGAFQQALQKTAQTPWRWQPSAIPAPQRGAPTPQLQQEQVPQEQRGRMPYGMPYGYGMTPPY